MIRLIYKNETEEKVSGDLFDRLVLKFEKVMGAVGDVAAGKVAAAREGHEKDIVASLRDGEVGLVLLSDDGIQKLNRDYRGKDEPTDVLSFAYLEGEQFEHSNHLGDIFISVDRSRQQAKEHGHEWTRELEILFVHGLLHLFGFDHGDDDEEREMEGWAEKVLR